jgi:hypothetical protein
MSPITSIPVYGVSVSIDSPPKPLEFFMGSVWIATIQALPESVVNLPANVQYGDKGKNLT